MTKTFLHKELSYKLLACAYTVHSHLGPGLLESSYETCFEYELKKNDFYVERQRVLPIAYDGLQLESGYRIDLLVEDEIIIELKCVDEITNIHKAQLMTYLKLAGKKVGYLINFNVAHLRDGIIRIVV